jgi:hypothetical protein
MSKTALVDQTPLLTASVIEILRIQKCELTWELRARSIEKFLDPPARLETFTLGILRLMVSYHDGK